MPYSLLPPRLCAWAGRVSTGRLTMGYNPPRQAEKGNRSMSDKKPLVEKIAEFVEKTGFPLESDCIRLLSSKGWIVSKGSSFLDPDESILREVDIGAIKMERYGRKPFPCPVASISLTIECKTSERPWIFFPASVGMRNPLTAIKHSTSIENLLPTVTMPAKVSAVSADDLAGWGHPYSEPVSQANTYLVYASKPKDASGYSIRSAMMSAVKSMNDQLKRSQKYFEATGEGYALFYYPIVVLRGALFEATSDDTGQVAVKGSWHVRVDVDYLSPDQQFNYSAMRHIVDVVHEKALPQYLDSLETSHIPLFARVGELLPMPAE